MSGNEGVANPPQSLTELPSWAQDYIASLRQEAADNRVKKNQLQSELTAANNSLATLQTEKAAAETASTAAQQEARKLLIALEAGIPGDKAVSYAPRLVGTTDDELKADAQKLAADLAPANGTPIAPQPATDRSQGANNAGSSVSGADLSPGAKAFTEMVYGTLRK